MANRCWFQQKTHGYGVVPATWEGWAVCGGYSALILFLIWGLPFVAPVRGTLLHVGIVFTVVIPATALLIWICWRRAEGEWRWRP